jgi:outer membrane biosynthesis protein TonB
VDLSSSFLFLSPLSTPCPRLAPPCCPRLAPPCCPRPPARRRSDVAAHGRAPLPRLPPPPTVAGPTPRPAPTAAAPPGRPTPSPAQRHHPPPSTVAAASPHRRRQPTSSTTVVSAKRARYIIYIVMFYLVGFLWPTGVNCYVIKFCLNLLINSVSSLHIFNFMLQI